ncbi:MAG: low molecular weight phosphotyrosine protein phosphatase [Streptosporangiales bacterium]|nr:low molecular weight phosphotyrosine protein phosphatase [Streptosporangiales bacterium]MBO0891290.1 low molecular weight phosphotyrosine protein phosphatase [Acidothermales bacterium]
MSRPSHPYRVCFVCTGNICRSPMAEAVFRGQVRRAGLADRIEVDSAGTGDWYTGDPPQPGTLEVLRQHGIDGSDLRARGFEQGDFERFDLIACLDTGHRDELRPYAGPYADRLRLLREYDPDADSPNVPDPYLGPLSGFELAYALIEPACRGLLDAVTDDLGAVER